MTTVSQQFSSFLPSELVERLLECYTELKQSYYLGKHRPSELEGGRFVEVVVRILQYLTNPQHAYTPLGRQLPRLKDVIDGLEKLPSSQFHESLRLHIPRAIIAIYGVRSRRDVGHVGGDVSSNLADATLVTAVCDWVLAELLRLFYACPLEEAQRMVDSLVERKVPIIQHFGEFPKLLRPDLSVDDKILVLLHQKSPATPGELRKWIKTVSGSTVSKALRRLELQKAYIHRDGGRCFITWAGIRFVERNIPFGLER